MQVKQPMQQRQLAPVKTIRDIVITANPRSPPLSVFVLSHMLADQYGVLLTSFVHSSARNIVSQQLLNVFNAHRGIVTDRNAYQLGITIIWKDGKIS